MAIGERIRFFRKMRKMTQRTLGMKVGFPEGSADIRITQYESGTRRPGPKYIEEFARALGVSPHALNVPDDSSPEGVLHTLFALEDTYGLTVDKQDNKVYLKIDRSKGRDARVLSNMLRTWKEQADKLADGEITKEDYDNWRYNHP